MGGASALGGGNFSVAKSLTARLLFAYVAAGSESVIYFLSD